MLHELTCLFYKPGPDTLLSITNEEMHFKQIEHACYVKMAGSRSTRMFSDGNKFRAAYLQQIFLMFQVSIAGSEMILVKYSKFYALKMGFISCKFSQVFQGWFFDSFELDIPWQREMAEIVKRFSCRIMFPLSIGTMGVNIGSKITCKQQEICNWSTENTLRVVYLSVY